MTGFENVGNSTPQPHTRYIRPVGEVLLCNKKQKTLAAVVVAHSSDWDLSPPAYHGLGPEVRSFFHPATAFDITAVPAADLRVPTRMSLLHDAIYWYTSFQRSGLLAPEG